MLQQYDDMPQQKRLPSRCADAFMLAIRENLGYVAILAIGGDGMAAMSGCNLIGSDIRNERRVMACVYEKIGGDVAVRAAVAKMYDKILGDKSLAPFFDGVDVDALRRMQTEYVTLAFGGEARYTGRGLREAHKPLLKRGLSAKHFDAVLAHLGEAMRELDVSEETIRDAIAIVETTRSDVLNQ
jgi:hemoglobin